MKNMRGFIAKMRKCFAPRQGKSGASLPLVITIGAALAIWVVGILPMMMGSGTTALALENEYGDYLGSRSSIEYVKSELEHIVETEPPYTFAVIKDPKNEGQFATVPKVNQGGAGTNAEYTKYVTDGNTGTDLDDVPNMTDGGAAVTAICAVEQDEEDLNTYHMFISTYDNGEEGMRYTASYTLFGTVKINPEAYQQMEALPLGDYVLVDGILGGKFVNNAWTDAPNEIWKSSIVRGADKWVYGASSDAFDTLLDNNKNFEEWLLPADYNANAGEYTAVFKKTAQAAKLDADATQKDPIAPEPTTQGGSLMPYGTTADDTAKKNGATWIVKDGKQAVVHMYLDGKDVTVTDSFTVRYNGSTTTPSGSGTYRVTLDVKENAQVTINQGTDTEKTFSILQVNGLAHSSWKISIASGASGTISGSVSIRKEESRWGDKYYADISLDNGISGVLFAQTNSANPSMDDLKWVQSNSFELSSYYNNRVYYFYAYRPSSMSDGGVFTPAIEPVLVGTVGSTSSASINDGGSYMICDTGKTYALTVINGSLATVRLSDLGYSDSGLGFYTSSQPMPSWVFAEGGNWNNRYWQITYDGKYLSINNNRAGLSDTKRNLYIRSGKITQNNGYGNSLQIGSSVSTAPNATVAFINYRQGLEDISFASFDSVTVNATYGYTYKKLCQDHFSGISEIYFNGKQINTNSGTAIPSGTYLIVGKVQGQYCKLGDLTVNPVSNSNALTVTTAAVNGDDMKINLQIAGCSSDVSDRVHYFGYAPVEEETVGDFVWFAAGTATEFELRLIPGKYQFATAEFINFNYTYRVSDPVEYEIQWKSLGDLTFDKNQFEYDVTPLTDGTVRVDWYEIPKDTNGNYYFPIERLDLVFGSYDSKGTQDPVDDTIVWDDEWSEATTVYGVLIPKSKYQDTPLQLNPPMNTGKRNGHQNSAITAEQIYFMGDGCSINTYGNDIQITTDLLVIKSPLDVGYAGGTIHVKPYSSGSGKNDDSGKVLFFPMVNIYRNDVILYERYQFYLIEPGTSLMNPLEGQYKLVQSSKGVKNNITSGDNPKVTFCRAAENLFRKGLYPEIDLDIAYADEEQLLRILSGETLGWTVNGVLKGSHKNADYSSYVVCALVNKVDGAVTGLANRIMIAAKSSPTAKDLTLPDKVELTTRYLEIDAASVNQGSTKKQPFMLYNLGQSEDFFSWLSDMLGITQYFSKTLQLDHERTTTYTYDGGPRTEAARVARCDDGTNLFSNNISRDLMVTYTNTELKNYFSLFTGTVQTLDRYVTITGQAGGTGSNNYNHKIDIGAFSFETQLQIYANYIWFDDTDKEGTANDTYIDQIDFSYIEGSSNSAGLIINTQEYGYTSKDYLGLFSYNSGESYAGTIVYVGKPITVNLHTYGLFILVPYYKDTTTYTIEPGFYYVYAKPGGTNITELATNLLEFPEGSDREALIAANGGAKGAKKPYMILEDELKKYSIYIDEENGKLSDAYVDTGIYGSDATAFGGFSGGNVQ